MSAKTNPIAFIEDRIMVAADSNCWNWTGLRGGNGYGRVQLSRGSFAGAHRFSWSAYKGVIPQDMCVLHKCDNRLCVNPEHLFLGTVKDNTDDMMRKGRHVVPLGEAHGKSVLTEDIVRDMRKRVANGETQTSVAKLYGVTIANVNYIVRRITWKHIQ